MIWAHASTYVCLDGKLNCCLHKPAQNMHFSYPPTQVSFKTESNCKWMKTSQNRINKKPWEIVKRSGLFYRLVQYLQEQTAEDKPKHWQFQDWVIHAEDPPVPQGFNQDYPPTTGYCIKAWSLKRFHCWI